MLFGRIKIEGQQIADNSFPTWEAGNFINTANGRFSFRKLACDFVEPFEVCAYIVRHCCCVGLSVDCLDLGRMFFLPPGTPPARESQLQLTKAYTKLMQSRQIKKKRGEYF